jgi:hypothetical protein
MVDCILSKRAETWRMLYRRWGQVSDKQDPRSLPLDETK